MDAINCPKHKLICKIAIGALLIGAIWFHLAYDRHMVWPGQCTGLNMKIGKGEVVGVQLKDNILALSLSFPDQKVTKVIVYDYCKGEVLNSVEAAR